MFELQQEDMTEGEPSVFEVRGVRVVDVPMRRRVFQDGPDKRYTYKVCYHGRNMQWPCRLCEFEVERLKERD